MIFVDAARNAVTCIGRLGENNARVIRINVSGIMEKFPGVEFSLLNQRPGDPDAYPVDPANVTVDGGSLLWTVTSAELAKDGYGEFQVVGTVDGTIVKTIIYSERVDKALDRNGDPPEPWESWVEGVKDAAERAEEAAEQAEHIIDDTAGEGDTNKTWSADKLVSEIPDISGKADKVSNATSGNFAGLDANGNLTDSGKKAADFATQSDLNGLYRKPAGGIPSSDMASAVQTSLGKADTAYQKPSGGIPGTDLAEGVIPDPEDLIDDTAGTGDTDKVWSADKSASAVSTLNSAISSKQDAPETAGTSGQVLALDSNLSPVWVDQTGGGGSVDPQAIAEAVDDWCDENITNPDSPPLDRSLTSSSAAAPADLLGDIKNKIGATENFYTIIPVDEEGRVRTNSDPIDPTNIAKDAAYYKHKIIPCKEGEYFTVKGRDIGTASMLAVIVDSQYNKLRELTFNSYAVEFRLIVPPNGAYLIVNSGQTVTKVTKNRTISDDIPIGADITVDGWANNSFIPATGVPDPNVNRLSVQIPKNARSFTFVKGYQHTIFAWDGDTYLGWYDGTEFKKTSIDWKYSFFNYDLSSIRQYTLYIVLNSIAPVPADGKNVKFYVTEDPTLKVKNIPAESKAVGDALNDLRRNVHGYNSPAYYASDDDHQLVTSYSTLIGMYDQLVTDNPNYVTKNTLTHGTFTNYEYVFSMGNWNSKSGTRSQDAESNKPKVLLSAGTHGYERCSIMGMYLFAKALCESTEMSAVRENLIIKIIPVVCPSGYNNNSRTNSNGVNINRNFDANWSLKPEGQDYSGASPADQDETQVMQAWMSANTDAVLFIDWHNSAYTNELSYLATTQADGYAVNTKKGFFYGISHIEGHWILDRGIDDNNTIYGYTGVDTMGGTTFAYGNSVNIPSCLVETSWDVGTYGKDSNGSIGVNGEAFCAIIKGILEKYILT